MSTIFWISRSLRPAFPQTLPARHPRLRTACLPRSKVVGVTCVEFFVTPDGALLINEIAPRPHNSGHLTIEAAVTSQFEQHVRAICGLPLGDASRPGPAAMVNLLGDLWREGTPDWQAALAYPDVKLHLYGKREPRPGRKMGHLTVIASSGPQAGVHTAMQTAIAARSALTGSSAARARGAGAEVAVFSSPSHGHESV